MNYKKIALLALLLPALSYGQSKAARAKELNDKQFKVVQEMSFLSRRITEESQSYWYLRDIIFRYWNPSGDLQVEDKVRVLDVFLSETFKIFEDSGDLSLVIQQAPFVQEKGVNLYLIVCRIMVQNLLVDQLEKQYTGLLQELIAIKAELNSAR